MGANLLDFVSNTPLARGSIPDAQCPVCNDGASAVYGGKWSTLLGGGDDVNHTWEEGVCGSCYSTFTRERKYDFEWFCVGGRFSKTAGQLIAGIPVCFESYKYAHSGCGGIVVRRYTYLDGESEVFGLCSKVVDGVWQRQYRTFYVCLLCNEQIETDYDYWSGR